MTGGSSLNDFIGLRHRKPGPGGDPGIVLSWRPASYPLRASRGKNQWRLERLVELVGLEPTTSSLRTMQPAEIISLIPFDMTPFSSTENPDLL